MGLNAGKILEIKITTSPKEKILEYIQKYLFHTSKIHHRNTKSIINPLVITTPNPEQIMLARQYSWFADMLNRADVAIPDGIGLVWASQFLQQLTVNSKQLTVRDRIPGIEFMEDLAAIAAREHVRIGLIGGRGGVAVEALECLSQRMPGLSGWAQDGPEVEVGEGGIKRVRSVNASKANAIDTFDSVDTSDATNITDMDQYVARIMEQIRKSDTRMVFVGLGAPKQEYFIEKLSSALGTLPAIPAVRRWQAGQHSALIFMSVGGSFDIIAGRIKRAPLLARSIGFEWAWRLIQEPWRFRRQLALLKFVWLVLRERLSGQAR